MGDIILENKEVFFEEDPTTTRTLRNIRNTLRYQLSKEYSIEDKEIVESILSVHGLCRDNFDFVTNVGKFISSKLNDLSIDSNGNKNEKTIMGIIGEAVAPVQKAIGYDYLYRQMVLDYGKKEAKRLSGLMYDYSIPIHDSSKLLVPYCWAFDASNIVFEGRPFGQLKSKPPKRISSYVASLNETIHQMSNHLAGAIAVGSFFSDIAFILINREKISLKDLKENSILCKEVENTFQTFVHSVNHLSRISNESPFTNISVFDRPKIRNLFSDENMGWMLQTQEGNIDLDYFTDYILFLQDIFLDFFDKGDPLSNGMPYRFPVVTINITKDEDNTILDTEFFDNISKREIFRYNIYTSLGTHVASCCRLLSDTEMFKLGGQVNSFGGSALSLGSHRVCIVHTNRIALQTKSKEDFYSLLDQRLEDSVKILTSHRNLIISLTKSGLQPFLDLGWISINKMFSTVGLIAIGETIKTLGESSIEELLVFINEKVKNLSSQYKVPINIEQVPAETMAVRLVQVDKILFGEEKVPYELYSNQFIPLWEDSTLFERMEIDGKYNKLFTGGGIVHFNLGEKTTPTQNRELISYAVKCGCEHFALNAVYSKCENGHTTFGIGNVCPICQGQIVERLTRVVGFFTPVSSWNLTRREWEFPKRNFKKVE